MFRPIEAGLIILLATMVLTTCVAEEGVTPEQQPMGVELNPNGESKIFWVFDTPEDEWQQTGGPGSLVPGYEFGHCGDDYYANDWARRDGKQWGQSVYAGISGIVHVADIKDKNGKYFAWGKEVIIYNPETKFALRYAHLSEYDSSLNGQWISAASDKPLGKIGDTGLGTGPHLHLVLYKNVNSIDAGNPVSVSSCSVKNGECVKGATEYAAQFSFVSRASGSGSSMASAQPVAQAVTLTLYVHDGSADGPVLSGAEVIGRDAAGMSFSQITDTSGFVVITGSPGSWQFTTTKPGYDVNSWSQEITKTGTKHAYLFAEEIPTKSMTENGVPSTAQDIVSDSETSSDGELGNLINALKDKDAGVRLKAVEELGKLADARAVDPLIEVLRNDENSDVRQKAAWALGQIDDARTVDPLSYASVKDAGYYVRGEAYNALQKSTVGGSKVDTRSADPIIGALKDEDLEVRGRAAEALGQLKNAAAVDPLIEVLRNDENSDVRQKAAWALGRIDDARTVDPLSYASVKDAGYYVRGEAYNALLKSAVGGNKVDTRSVDPIIGALKDEDQGVRGRAAEALGQLKNAAAVDPLAETLRNDENSDVRQKAAWALGQIDDVRTVNPLSYASVKDAGYYVRGEAYNALLKSAVGGNKVDTRSVDPIIGALKDENPEVRGRAAEALGQLKNATTVDALIEALNDENSDVRQKAAWALGEIGDARAADPLNYASVKDAGYYVREEAKNALTKLGQQVE